MAATKATAEPVFSIDPTQVGRVEAPAKAPAAAKAKPTHERFRRAKEVRWRLAPGVPGKGISETHVCKCAAPHRVGLNLLIPAETVIYDTSSLSAMLDCRFIQ